MATTILTKAMIVIALFLTIATPNTTHAANVSGKVDIESRYFLSTALDDAQQDSRQAVTLNLTSYHDFLDGDARLVFDGVLRRESADDQGDVADIQELYWWQTFDDFELNVGYRKVFWGVTETRHLVDIINQTDNLANIDGEDKLGQPMASLLIERDWGTLESFVLFGVKLRQFAGSESRLRPPLPIDEANTQFQSSAGNDRIDWALRYSHVIGDWDLGLSYFEGTDRAPKLLLSQDGDQASLTPYYQLISQWGIDLQATRDSWLWKLEAIGGQVKQGPGYSALVAGAEYSYYGVFNSSADLGLLIEYQFDDRADAVANNDLAIGTRVAFNNSESSELLLAWSIDLDNQSQFLSIEASHRLSDVWTIEAQVRAFTHVDKNDLTFAYAQDDYAQLTLTHYF